MDSISVALHAVAIQQWLSVAVILSALLITLGGIWSLRRWAAGRRPFQAFLIWINGCLTIVLYGGVAFVFGVCWDGQIGEYGKNRLARAYGTPVVNALEAFHRDSSFYPSTLHAVVPHYLSQASLTAPESSALKYPFEYRADRGSFELLVRYGGPGMNECRIHPGSPWRCTGYY